MADGQMAHHSGCDWPATDCSCPASFANLTCAGANCGNDLTPAELLTSDFCIECLREAADEAADMLRRNA